MNPNIGEWLHLVLRGIHIVAAIMWIGSSLFFMWLDGSLERPENPKEGVEGELWMVHSGGFYQVEKKLVAPSGMPRTLHWFKWEAAFTWISGICLLVLLYYLGGGLLLVDPQVSSIGPGAATALGIGVLVVSWGIYDAMWSSRLREARGLAIALSVALVFGVAYGLHRTLSGRAAYMHVGAMLGTWMVANVWMRILPSQRALVAAVKEGKKPDPELGKRAKERSRHNNYMTYPVIFIMISNHFPNTYGSRSAWIILAFVFLASVAVRHYQNTRGGSPQQLLGALAALFALAYGASFALGSAAEGGPPKAAPAAQAKGAAKVVIDPATVGSIRVAVRFEGTAPPRAEVPLPGNCPHDGPVYDDKVLVKDGRLQNAFVWLAEGLGDWPSPPPTEPIMLDQRGCMYAPHVIGVQVGQPVAIGNSDPFLHNVRAVTVDNADFNAPMLERAKPLLRTFDSAEVMVKMKCDVHPWMSAYIGVVPHPFFGVTSPEGERAFDGVPPGEYVIEAWHETLGKQRQRVSLGISKKERVELTFKAN
jgi:uncharacterized membrane protein